MIMKECWINVYGIGDYHRWYGNEASDREFSILLGRTNNYRPLYRIHIKMKEPLNVPAPAKSFYDSYRGY